MEDNELENWTYSIIIETDKLTFQQVSFNNEFSIEELEKNLARAKKVREFRNVIITIDSHIFAGINYEE